MHALILNQLHNGIHDGIILPVRKGCQHPDGSQIRNHDAVFIQHFFRNLADHGYVFYAMLFQRLQNLSHFADINRIEYICIFRQFRIRIRNHRNRHDLIAQLFCRLRHIYRQVTDTSQ